MAVWSQSVLQKVLVPCNAPPSPVVEPIRLLAVRNGTFAGQAVVADDTPIQGLKVLPTALTGPATIPASAVRVRYGVADGFFNQYAVKPTWFDSLDDEVPSVVPLDSDTTGRAVQPLWGTVTVPADAEALRTIWAAPRAPRGDMAATAWSIAAYLAMYDLTADAKWLDDALAAR